MGLLSAIQDEQFWRDVAKNGRGLLQGASNAVASNITGPVDLINAGMGLLGMPISREPVGGEAWARKKGLTAAAPGAAGLAGETLGLVVPMVAAGKAPQIAAGMLKMADNAAAPSAANQAARNQLGAIVYHGSPHKFDRFDASKIGTGEGAQAYGHGLYFAENPAVAKDYATNILGESSFSFNGSTLSNVKPANELESVFFDNLRRLKDPLAAADATYYKTKKPWSEIKKISDKVVVEKAPGTVYKVDLPDNAIARMLDWDKPMVDQSKSYLNLAKEKGLPYRGNTPKGGMDIYNALVDEMGGHQQAADFLRSQGIPGIRYLDAGSRGAGAGTSNYVVFPGEEGLLSIISRNGMAP